MNDLLVARGGTSRIKASRTGPRWLDLDQKEAGGNVFTVARNAVVFDRKMRQLFPVLRRFQQVPELIVIGRLIRLF